MKFRSNTFRDTIYTRDRTYAFLVVAGLTLCLLLWAFWLRASYPHDGFFWNNFTGEVMKVEPNGPASGLIFTSDRITAVGDRSLPILSSLYLDYQVGNTVEIMLERDDRLQTVEIALVSPPWNYRLAMLLPLIVAFAFWLIGILVFSFQTNSKESRLFFLVCQAGSVAVTTGAISAIGPPYISRLFGISLWWLIPFAFSLHLHFPIPNSSLRLRGFEKFHYVAAGLLSVLQLYWPAAAFSGTRSYFQWLSFRQGWLALGLLSVIFLLLRAYYLEPSRDARGKVGAVTLGGAFALLLFLSVTLAPDILLGKSLVPYHVSFLFLLIIPISYLYAIRQYRFIRMEKHIHHSALSSFTLLVLCLLYLIFSFFCLRFIPESMWQNPLTFFVILFAFALAFQPLKQVILKYVSRLFYGGEYDFSTKVQQVSRAIEDTSNLSAMGRSLVKELQKTMQLESVHILLPNGSNAFTGESAFSDDPYNHHIKPARVDAESLLIRLFQERQQPLTGQVLRQSLDKKYLSKEELDLIYSTQSSFWIPLQGSGGLIGLLILGSKYGKGELKPDDLQLLNIIARQASIAFENAKLSSELQNRNLEYTRLNQRVLHVIEEERKRLAWELHDQIIQTLTGLNLQLSELKKEVSLRGQDKFHATVQQLCQVIDDLRNICSDLRPPTLDSLGLPAAVRSLVRSFSENITGFRVGLDIDMDEDWELPEQVSMCLFRVLQESLTNAERHSQAQQVNVILSAKPGEITMRIEDDGKGFLLPKRLGEFSREGHFGLMGMRERVESLGGIMEIYSTLNAGCQIIVHIPIHPLIVERP